MKQEIPLAYAHRLLAPRPVCMLTARYKGQVNVMTVAWVGPISLQPPLLAIAIHPSCHTHEMLKRSEECVLNIPGRPLAEQATQCGKVSGREVDKVARLNLELVEGQRVEAPWLDDCLAHIECQVVDILAPGDHTVFVVKVVGGWAEDEAFAGVWLTPQDNDELQPLCHLGGDQFSLPGKKLSLP